MNYEEYISAKWQAHLDCLEYRCNVMEKIERKYLKEHAKYKVGDIVRDLDGHIFKIDFRGISPFGKPGEVGYSGSRYTEKLKKWKRSSDFIIFENVPESRIAMKIK